MKNIVNHKAFSILALFSAGLMLVSSCKKDDPEPIVYGNANIRVINAAQGADPQDFYQGQTKVSTSAVAYGSASTGYYTIPGGPTNLSFRNASSGAISAQRNVTIEGNTSYSVFLYKGANGNLVIEGVDDDNTPPPTGKARVRFLNLGFSLNNSLNVIYSSNGTVLLGNQGLGLSNYTTIDANTDLGVTVIGSPVTTAISGSNFVAGKIYTVWFDSSSATTVTAHVVQQN